jgi:hypothetical protein
MQLCAAKLKPKLEELALYPFVLLIREASLAAGFD